jgi:hypothetical protein
MVGEVVGLSMLFSAIFTAGAFHRSKGGSRRQTGPFFVELLAIGRRFSRSSRTAKKSARRKRADC